MNAANLRALRLHYAASNLPGAIPFTTFAARRDAEHVAARITADETDGWRYKVAARPSGYVVEVYDVDNLYFGGTVSTYDPSLSAALIQSYEALDLTTLKATLHDLREAQGIASAAANMARAHQYSGAIAWVQGLIDWKHDQANPSTTPQGVERLERADVSFLLPRTPSAAAAGKVAERQWSAE